MKLSFWILSFITLVQGALLGIDFGTEYTKAVLIAPNVPYDILLNQESKRKDVSGLSLILPDSKSKFKSNDDIIRQFGSNVLSNCIKSPGSCVVYVKSLLGLGTNSDIMQDYHIKFKGVGLGLQKDRNATTLVVTNKNGEIDQTFLVEEVVAMQLLEIKKRALNYWKERSPETYTGIIDGVVISVPKYFTEAAKLALKNSAELADLKVISLVNDGLAIALDYAQKMKSNIQLNEKEYHLIFDAGAGAIKATLVSILNNSTDINDNGNFNIKVENYAYSDKLNGELFTIMVRAHILEQFSEFTGIPIEEIVVDAKTMWKSWHAAERAKLILSANTETNINIESFYKDYDYKGFMTRDELEARMEISLTGLTNILDSVFEIEGFDISKDLNSVIISGGSSRVPIIQEILSNYLGKENESKISKNVNADESVVFGTSLYGAQIMKLTKKDKFVFNDKNSLNYDLYYTNGEKGGMINIPVGLSINEKYQTNLTAFDNEFLKEIKIEMIENGEFKLKEFKFTTPKRFNETVCNSDISYMMNYEFGEDGIFNIHNIKIECLNDIGNNTIIPRTGIMHSEVKYFGFEPMTEVMKKVSIKRLSNLDKKDEERLQIEDAKNLLEGKLYELRYSIEDLEENEQGNIDSDFIEETKLKISDNLEWLDYESDNANLQQINFKIGNIDKEFEMIENILILNDKDQIKELFEKLDDLQEKANHCFAKIQSKEDLLKTESQIYGVNYDELVSKLSGNDYPSTEVDAPEQITAVEDVKSIKIEISKFEKLCDSIENTWELRRGLVNQELNIAKQKLKKEQKRKEEEMAASKLKEETNEEEENNTEEAKETESVKHDEL